MRETLPPLPSIEDETTDKTGHGARQSWANYGLLLRYAEALRQMVLTMEQQTESYQTVARAALKRTSLLALQRDT